MNEGLLILRIGVAAILFMHATQKVFGWFQGPGLTGATAVFQGLGQSPGRPMVLLAASCELVCATSVALGLAMFAGAAVGVGVMFVAGGSMTLRARRVWNNVGGGEYPLVLALVLVALGFTGPGRYSVDGSLGVPWFDGRDIASYWVGLGVFVVAAVGAVPPLAKARSALPKGRRGRGANG